MLTVCEQVNISRNRSDNNSLLSIIFAWMCARATTAINRYQNALIVLTDQIWILKFQWIKMKTNKIITIESSIFEFQSFGSRS